MKVHQRGSRKSKWHISPGRPPCRAGCRQTQSTEGVGHAKEIYIDLNTHVQPQKVDVGVTMDLEDQQQWGHLWKDGVEGDWKQICLGEHASSPCCVKFIVH